MEKYHKLKKVFEKGEIETGIPRRFESIVKFYPDKLAIDDPEHRLSYKTINQIANQIAHHLIVHTDSDKQLIGLLFHSATQCVVAMIAVLKAGKAFVVIDPSESVDQCRAILKSTNIQWIVTNSGNIELAHRLLRDINRVIDIGQMSSSTPKTNLELDVNGDYLAAVYFTSGSTGRSKGVMRTHRTLLHRAWFDYSDLLINSTDKISFLYDCRFAASSVDIFASLMTGATLIPFDIKENSYHQFGLWLIEKEISILHPPLSYIRDFFSVLPSDIRLKYLRVLSIGGSRLRKKEALEIYKRLPNHCKLHYRYSCSEASLITRWFLNPSALKGPGLLPVGFPITDKQLKIIDEMGHEAEPGEVGEIAVSSRYLSVGYWKDQYLSSTKFHQLDASTGDTMYLTGDMGRLQTNGCLQHLGRKDSMVKIRGYRIELEAIDRALLKLPDIRDAVVIAHELHDASHRLVAYVIFANSYTNSKRIDRIREELTEYLPDYMIPSQYIILGSLPQTATGKPDRQALPSPEHRRHVVSASYTAPTTPFEEILCEIWSNILGYAKVGIHDSFFALGGNSLQAMRIASQLQLRFGVEIPAPQLFGNSTVAEMALLVLTSMLAQESNTVQIRERPDD